MEPACLSDKHIVTTVAMYGDMFRFSLSVTRGTEIRLQTAHHSLKYTSDLLSNFITASLSGVCSSSKYCLKIHVCVAERTQILHYEHQLM